MNSEWLTDYIVLLETGSFSKAAEKRAITHTAFGRRIKQLEQWAGVTLIERSQPVKPTQAGHLFLEAAQTISDTLTQVRAQLKDPSYTPKKAIKIATGRTLGSNFFPGWYQEMIERIGFSQMAVLTSGTEIAILRFIAQESDLLIAYKTPMTDLLLSNSHYQHKVVGKELIVPVTASPEIRRIDLNRAGLHPKIRWLSYDKSLSLKALVTNFLTRKAVLPNLNAVFESDNYELLREMVLENVGIAWLPYSVVQKPLQQKTLFLLEDRQWQLTVNIVLYKRVVEEDAQVNLIWNAVSE